MRDIGFCYQGLDFRWLWDPAVPPMEVVMRGRCLFASDYPFSPAACCEATNHLITEACRLVENIL